jgi:hypothetical protein
MLAAAIIVQVNTNYYITIKRVGIVTPTPDRTKAYSEKIRLFTELVVINLYQISGAFMYFHGHQR